MSRSNKDNKYGNGGKITPVSKRKHIYVKNFSANKDSAYKHTKLAKKGDEAMERRHKYDLHPPPKNSLVQLSKGQYKSLKHQLKHTIGDDATVRVRGRLAETFDHAAPYTQTHGKGGVKMEFTRNGPNDKWNHLKSAKLRHGPGYAPSHANSSVDS